MDSCHCYCCKIPTPQLAHSCRLCTRASETHHSPPLPLSWVSKEAPSFLPPIRQLLSWPGNPHLSWYSLLGEEVPSFLPPTQQLPSLPGNPPLSAELFQTGYNYCPPQTQSPQDLERESRHTDHGVSCSLAAHCELHCHWEAHCDHHKSAPLLTLARLFQNLVEDAVCSPL